MEMLVSIMIMVVALMAAAYAIGWVARSQLKTDAAYSVMNDLRMAANMIGEDVHYAYGVSVIGNNELIIQRKLGQEAVRYQILVIPGSAGERGLYRKLPSSAQGVKLIGRLDENSRFDYDPSHGGAKLTLISKPVSGVPSMTISTLFVPHTK